MPHAIWHIICGLVGIRIENGSQMWPAWSGGAVCWRLEIENHQLQHKLDNIAFRMAQKIARATGLPMSPMETLHGYCMIGIGERGESRELETYYGSDAFVMYMYNTLGIEHRKANVLKCRLEELRWRYYRLVTRVTGGEVYSAPSYQEEHGE